MSDVTVVFDNAAIKAWASEHGSQPQAALDYFAGVCVVNMKRLCPVSPVQAVYAYPVPPGSSTGSPHTGRPISRPAGPAVPRSRAGGDLPLRPSGYLRSSIHAFRQADGSIIVGPTAPYAKFVNDDTEPHVIKSTGPWPLRNRASGQVFGPVVHHPGTKGAHFIEQTAALLNGERVET